MRSCFPVPGYSNEAYFFHGTKYARIRFVPSSPDEQIIFGPASVAHEWKTLARAGFTTIDAALPVPGHVNQVYFFSGTRYVRVEFTPGTPEERIVFGPANIADEWKALVKAGFETVDAILPVPGHEGQAYFFSGNQYAKISFVPGTPTEDVQYGPASIVGEWKTLGKAGFDTVDAVLPVPGREDEAYFFSGSQYVKIKFVPSSSTEEILYGPVRIVHEWKTLTWGW
jgi:hypothetical protein